ncbi:unnamed protein product [Pieris brassicae]|uniref:HTH CENPB-type domain-containing protein n=1 Tax=Pieris brassicae TaxID=7116 RepID=A0A9P0TUX1_PIEBR|nr:unnamed protein product [Pieris brassicae]
MPISGPLVKSKAENVAEQLGLTSFKASEGWIGKFKQCHHNNYGKISGRHVAANMDGTEKRKLMVIGKSKNSRRFNKSAWMTSYLFEEVRKWDAVIKGRKKFTSC